MANIAIDKKDQIVMSLVHFFVTKENYAPILVQGVKNEIWLQNLDGPYKVIRINSNYIHNSEQYDFDIFKVKSIVKQIKKKTLSLKMNVLNIYLDCADRVKLSESKNIDSIEIKDFKDLKTNDIIQASFPKIETRLIKENNGLDLIYNVSNEINIKTEKENKLYESVFKPKKIIFTKLLICLCVVAFLLMYILGNGSNDTLTLIQFGANYGPLVKSGQVFRLLTSAFLHIGVIHLLVNMYSLYVIGSQVENYIGKWKFLLIYFVSAISGNLLSVVFNTGISAGASGAIFGLLGALLYFGLHYRLFLGNVLVTQIIPVIILNLFIGFTIPGIDNSAHIGGLVGGYLATMALGLKGKSAKQDRINGLIVLILYLAFLIYLAFFR